MCQAHDLLPGEKPHDYSASEADAIRRYRREPDELDSSIAAYYWEAVWLEGVASPLLPALRSAAQITEPDVRQIVLLAADDDADARLSALQFLPVCVLPGVVDPGTPVGARYGAVRQRVRERTAWALAERLREYRERVLVVVGAACADDLERLTEVLQDCPLIDLEVVLVWPPQAHDPGLPSSPSVVVHVWRGSEEEFLTAMAEAGAPGVADIERHSVRVGTRSLGLRIREIDRILSRFAFLTEQHIGPATAFKMENLLAFLDGSLEDWSAYGAGLPVERLYRSQGKPLHEDVLATLRQVQERSRGTASTFVMRLPAEPGAGVTTLLRAAAYTAAREGFPTLVLRPEQIAVDHDELAAFATVLSEGALSLGIEQAPPLLVVLDVEHDQRGINARSVAGALARQGRSAVVLHATALQDAASDTERRTQRMAVLPQLRADLDTPEVEQCWQTMSETVDRWSLPMAVPSTYQWGLYDRATRWPLKDEHRPGGSLFWVALRFFLTEGMGLSEAEHAQSLLGRWITERSDAITDTAVRDIVKYVAVMSSFRLPSPVWTVIRPAVGGTYPSQLSAAVRQLDGIVTWAGAAKGIDEDMLRFLHPALARAYLGHFAAARSPEQRMQQLLPVLRELSPGSTTDIWVAESLAKDVLAPRYEDRDNSDWDWRLETFERIPPAIRDQSKAILHHWARLLYQSAGQQSAQLPIEQRLTRFATAIEKLETATELPRRAGRDEHPSHLYNTLGTANYRYSLALQEAGRETESATAWAGACAAFEEALELSGGVNMDALLAFSHRLLNHASSVGDQEQVVKAAEVTHALELLGEAENLAASFPAPDPVWAEQITKYRANAFSQLSSDLGETYLDGLIRSADPELGYYCKAWLCVLAGEIDYIDRALTILDDAERAGVVLQNRSVRLRILLLERQPYDRRDFVRLKSLYQRLDAEHSETVRPLDLFRYAVLCYQTEDYSTGAECFMRLRAQSRREDSPAIRMSEVWRKAADPAQPRLTQMRVDRRITDWRAQGYLLDLHQSVPFRPRHFSPPPDRGDIVTCAIRFESNGPLAIPARFVESGIADRRVVPPGAE
ncbi:hypothetical protein OG563_28615 [Nocardia vinacea]|uniref:Tetratricopeptide repeat protein n=1 Tax=Nocardia vinacea TaxID=96468 RepID=A0ABZ1YJ01_9NOCA|nr:hypothetical protein [Nocardia vinacea]